MKTLFLSFAFLLGCLQCMAQEQSSADTRQLIVKGRSVYQVEMASRLAEKVFPSTYKGKEKIGGLVAYPDADKVKVVYYNKGNEPKAIGTVVFDMRFSNDEGLVLVADAALTDYEKNLIAIKEATLEALQDKTTFTSMSQTHLTAIPLIHQETREVYVIAESDIPGVVVFGNDYVFDFDNKNKLNAFKPLHKFSAKVNFDPSLGSGNDTQSKHNHASVEGELPTVTDIAILYLNEKATGWTHHTFIGENAMFFWSFVTNELQVVPKKPVSK
jgi:hypothetical protein